MINGKASTNSTNFIKVCDQELKDGRTFAS